MLRLLKISGDSLYPEFREGDFVLVIKIPFLLDSYNPGDVVVFRHPEYGVLIKRVDHVLPGGGDLYVTGDHEHSVDSRRFGPVPRRAVLGKVAWHLHKQE